MWWSHVWMPVEWPTDRLLSMIAVALPVSIAAGILGAFLADGLRGRLSQGRGVARLVPAGAVVVIAVVFAILLPTSVPSGASVQLTLSQRTGGDRPEAVVTAKFTPANVADKADWVRYIAWQGEEPLRGAQLTRISEGVYRTPVAVPIYGSWKTAIRVQNKDVLVGAPVYLPADPGIPVAGVPARPNVVRPMIADRKLLQRERKDDVPTWLWTVAGMVVGLLCASLLGLLGWGLRRISRPDEAAAAETAPAPTAEQPRTPAGVA